jgi:phosphatidylserine/phosphatidylglycerophosphate/cardiolipin synthase-like enzyme
MRIVGTAGVLLVLAGCGATSSSSAAASDGGTAPEASVDAHVEAEAEAAVPPACSETDPRTPPAKLIVMPDDGEGAFVSVLQQATKTIDVMIYDLGTGAILSELESKAKAGVAVRAILDQSEQSFDQPAFYALTAAGAKCEWSSTQFTYMHAKTFVVDGRTAVVSSGNFDASQMMVERNYAAVDSDPQDVEVLEALFDADFARKNPSLSCTRLLVSPVNSQARILALLNAAKKSVYVESMEFANGTWQAAVVAQHKSGLDVKVLLADTGFVSENSTAYGYLKANGVPGEYLADPVLHVKSIIVDGERAYLGSENLSYTSLNENREVGLEILASNGEDVARMTSTFMADWAKGTAVSP